ncbi:MAG: hypothetical protein V3R25_05895 [Nitrosomonadaceae bacterium]
MATTLYKTIDGEIKKSVVQTSQVRARIASGWRGTKEEGAVSNPAMTNDEIRSAAKDAGIEGYKNKQIKTLITELAA